MKRRFIMPSALGVMLTLCLLALQAILPRGTSQSISGGMSRTETDYLYGFPTMVRIVDSEVRGAPEVRQVMVAWERIAGVVTIAWCLSMPIGRWVTGYVRRDGSVAGPIRSGWSHPATILGYVLAGCAVVGTIASIAFGRTFGSGVTPAEGGLAFFLLFMIASVPVTMIVMIVRRRLYRARIDQRGFAVEIPAEQG